MVVINSTINGGYRRITGTFRLGPMPHEIAVASLTLFMQQVAPQFRPAALAAK